MSMVHRFLVVLLVLLGSCSFSTSSSNSNSSRKRTLLAGCSDITNCPSLIIEGGIQVEQCTVDKDTILLSGSLVLPEIFVLVDGVTQCCTACAGQEKCNSWNYCTSEDGCSVPDLFDDASTSVALINATVPEKSCILLAIKRSSAAEVSDKGKQPSKEYFSGQVQRIFLPSMTGYSTNSGKNISSTYDYTCGYSPKKPRCEIAGSVAEVSSICTADSRCRGFVYGVNNTANGETIGVLKGGDPTMGLFTEETLEDDPSWTVYALTEQGLEAQQVTEQSSSSSIDLWIILVSVIGGVLLVSIVAATCTFAIMSKRYSKAVKENTLAWQLAAEPPPLSISLPGVGKSEIPHR